MMSDPPATKRPKVDNEEEKDSTATKDDHQNGLHFMKEQDVGITEYLNDYPGTFAILKRRCVLSTYN